MRRQSVAILCALAGLFCCRAQLQWLDSDAAVSTVLEPAPFAFLMILPQNPAECEACGSLTSLFQMAGANFPYITAVDCSLHSVRDSKFLSSMCDGVMDEPRFRKWNGVHAGEKTSPFNGRRSSDGLVQWISEGFQQMQEAARAGLAPPIQLLMPFLQQSEAMKQGLERAASAARADARGEVTFLSDQLPAWFRCTEYSFTGDGSKALGALLESEFLPSFGVQHKYSGRQWRMQWELLEASSQEVLFAWWESVAGAEQPALSSTAQPRRRRVTLRRAPGSDGRVGRECAAAVPGLEEEEGRVVLRTAQAGAAYDWMRFRFFEFAEHMAAAIARRERSLPRTAAAPVFLDPMCGQGWELALLKARFGRRLTTVCSDIHGGSVALAQADFAANQLLDHGNALFLVGDLFEPLRARVAQAEAAPDPEASPSPRPRYVYVLPPQEPPPARVPEGINSAFFFTPDGDPLHFHKRIAAELPSMLADGAIVWLSVEFDKEDGVHEAFGARVEALFAAAGWPPMERIFDHAPAAPYFNPSGLVQFDWGVRGDGEQQEAKAKKKRRKTRRGQREGELR